MKMSELSEEAFAQVKKDLKESKEKETDKQGLEQPTKIAISPCAKCRTRKECTNPFKRI